MTDKEESSYMRLWRLVSRFLALKTEDVKLTLSEKLTILISTLAVAALLGLLGGIALMLLTFSAANWIAESFGMKWAWLILAGGYLLVLLVVVIFRKPLVINPVSRFVTRLLLS